MNTAHRFLSLSILGTMALAFAPLASAAGFGFGMQGNTEVRTELRACRDAEDRDAAKACKNAVFAKFGIEKPERPDRPEISDEIKAELSACKENNAEDRDAAKTCAKAVFEANGITPPPMRHRGRRMRFGIRQKLQTCADMSTLFEMRACILGNIQVDTDQ